MKVIRLFYGYSDSELATKISFYFRLIGVYVFEKCFDDTIDLQVNVDSLKTDYLDVSNERNNMRYDVEIFLISNKEQYLEFQRAKKEQRVCISVKCRDIEDIDEGILANQNVLKNILSAMEEKDVIEQEELEDCLATESVYMNKKYFMTALGARYCFPISWWIDKKSQEYDEIREHLLGEIESKQLYKYTLFAVANITYEADYYCKRNSRDFNYDVEELIKLVENLDKKFGDSLGNSIRRLLGQIYYDLLDKANTGYEFYLKCCDSEENQYNSYIFMLKGKYWHNFVGDYERANKYYFKSILIYPEYYSAWYKMGYCYYQMNQKEKAFIAFDTVQKILFPRVGLKRLRPKEIEHLFLSCVFCSGIIYDLYADAEQAIQYDREAENVWKEISEQKVSRLLYDSEDEMNKICEEIKKQLDIQNVYIHLSKMYKICNDIENANRYEKMYM